MAECVAAILVPPIADREQACRGSAEIDDDEEDRRQHVHTEMCPQPRNTKRQRHRRRYRCAPNQMNKCNGKSGKRGQEAKPVDGLARHLDPAHGDADARRGEEKGHAAQGKNEWQRSRHDIPRMCLAPIVRGTISDPAGFWANTEAA